MSVWVGPLGGLVETACLSGLAVSREPALVERRDINGNRRVRKHRPSANRTWTCDLGAATPAEIARLVELEAAQDEPWWLVACDAHRTNLLTPRAARFQGWTINGPAGQRHLLAGGMAPLEDGGLALRSGLPDYFGTDWAYWTPLWPVDPSGGPVTASIYLRASIGLTGQMRINWYDGAGNPHIITPTSASASTTTSAGPLPRLSVTATPPAGAHAGRIQFRQAAVAANPAVTWGDTLYDWTDGRGAEHVVLTPVQESLINAHPSIARTNGTYSILEVAA